MALEQLHKIKQSKIREVEKRRAELAQKKRLEDEAARYHVLKCVSIAVFRAKECQGVFQILILVHRKYNWQKYILLSCLEKSSLNGVPPIQGVLHFLFLIYFYLFVEFRNSGVKGK